MTAGDLRSFGECPPTVAFLPEAHIRLLRGTADGFLLQKVTTQLTSKFYKTTYLIKMTTSRRGSNPGGISFIYMCRSKSRLLYKIRRTSIVLSITT